MLSLVIHQNPVKPEKQSKIGGNHRFQEQSESLLLPQPQLEPKLYLLFRPAPRKLWP